MDRTNVIGEKIKALRTTKEISIDELAERTGLSAEQIERIEQNIDIPSLAPLLKLARALGVRLGTFLDDQNDEAGPVICRRGEADDTISFSNNATNARQHMHYHSLSRSKADRHMEPFIIDIDANKDAFTLERNAGNQLRQIHLHPGRRGHDLLRFHRTASRTRLRRASCPDSGGNLYAGLTLGICFTTDYTD